MLIRLEMEILVAMLILNLFDPHKYYKMGFSCSYQASCYGIADLYF